MNKKILTLGIVTALTIIAVMSFYNINTPTDIQPTNDPIKIGLVLGQTGSASTWAEYAKKAADLAAKEINDNGGINGKRLELIYEDSQTNPALSVSSFKKLTEVDHVSVIVGDLWSFLTNPLVPLSADKKILTISPTVMDGAVQGQSDYFYTLGHTVESQRGAVDSFINDNPTAKTVAIMCWNDAWGKTHSKLFAEVSEGRGLKVLGEICTANFASDYRSEVVRVKAMKPDIIMVTTSLPISLFKAMYDLKINIPTLTTTVMIDGLEVQKMPREYAMGKYFMDWQPNAEFIQKFKKAYGTTPIMEAQNSYEAVRTIAKALEKNPGDILVGLKQVSYQSVDGSMDFTKGDHITVNKAQARLFKVTETGYEEIK
jgi:branched-chain amino acid transport system substrate-binding protein